MKTHRSTRTAAAVLCAVLAACGQTPRANNSNAGSMASSAAAPVSSAARTPALPAQRSEFASVDTSKSDAALHIMRHNPDRTFSGALPPMLPAIVVLRITVDQTGKVTRAIVQRSRDDDASKVALASIQRTGYLPRPANLAVGPGRSLTYMETFLFNEDYRFQLRTLAPLQ